MQSFDDDEMKTGYYSPIPDRGEAGKRWLTGDDLRLAQPDNVPGIEMDTERHIDVLEKLLHHKNHVNNLIKARRKEPVSRLYKPDSAWLGFGDATILAGMMLSRKPRKIVEAGGGFTTALMLDAIEIDEKMRAETELLCVEPNPQRLENLLNSNSNSTVTDDRFKITGKKLQDEPIDTFLALDAGDLLFIDSSHVLKAGSDLEFLLGDVLPILKPGVIVHFHDVFWPFQYPRKWIRNGRYWNEAFAIRSFLQFNDNFRIIFFNNYAERFCRSFIAKKWPLMLRQPSHSMSYANTSLWIERKK
ncbi:MAG: class I SAM-dependent methyltransferase [Balneolales bacterium]|nr:class I SAM-dependent methyltransferase [Balneolales bacterium]